MGKGNRNSELINHYGLRRKVNGKAFGRWRPRERAGGRKKEDGRWTTDDGRRTKDDGRGYEGKDFRGRRSEQ